MPSTPSPQAYWAPNSSSINVLHKDLALSPDDFGGSEAALSYDFQLFPDEELPVSSSPMTSHGQRVAQDVVGIRKVLREERYQTTLPLQGSSRQRQYLPAVDQLPHKLDPAGAAMAMAGHGRRHSAQPYATRTRREFKPRSPPRHPGSVQSLTIRHQPRHSETQLRYGESNIDDSFLSSPPPAPRIERLPTPDLVPMEARPFCDCCTTPGPRKLCELCRKRKVRRDYDLLGVGTKFD